MLQYQCVSYKPKQRMLFPFRGVGEGLTCWPVFVLKISVLPQWWKCTFKSWNRRKPSCNKTGINLLSPLVQTVTCSQAAVISLINASSYNDFVTLEVSDSWSHSYFWERNRLLWTILRKYISWETFIWSDARLWADTTPHISVGKQLSRFS